MLKGCHFPDAVILMAIRWYCRYKRSYRDIEELMAERGVEVDHATVNRWAAATIMGIELAHMIRKGQVRPLNGASEADQFYALAA